MTHSYVCHDSFICVLLLMHISLFGVYSGTGSGGSVLSRYMDGSITDQVQILNSQLSSDCTHQIEQQVDFCESSSANLRTSVVEPLYEWVYYRSERNARLVSFTVILHTTLSCELTFANLFLFYNCAAVWMALLKIG